MSTIDEPEYVGNSERRIIVQDESGIREVRAYSLDKALAHLIPTMPKRIRLKAARQLKSPNDFGEATFTWNGRTICQTWGYVKHPADVLMAAAIDAGTGMFSGGYWARIGRE